MFQRLKRLFGLGDSSQTQAQPTYPFNPTHIYGPQPGLPYYPPAYGQGPWLHPMYPTMPGHSYNQGGYFPYLTPTEAPGPHPGLPQGPFPAIYHPPPYPPPQMYPPPPMAHTAYTGPTGTTPLFSTAQIVKSESPSYQWPDGNSLMAGTTKAGCGAHLVREAKKKEGGCAKEASGSGGELAPTLALWNSAVVSTKVNPNGTSLIYAQLLDIRSVTGGIIELFKIWHVSTRNDPFWGKRRFESDLPNQDVPSSNDTWGLNFPSVSEIPKSAQLGSQGRPRTTRLTNAREGRYRGGGATNKTRTQPRAESEDSESQAASGPPPKKSRVGRTYKSRVLDALHFRHPLIASLMAGLQAKFSDHGRWEKPPEYGFPNNTPHFINRSRRWKYENSSISSIKPYEILLGKYKRGSGMVEGKKMALGYWSGNICRGPGTFAEFPRSYAATLHLFI
ncbi:hypothetical protein B0H11DRAFT_1903780 [Mycena galericulata]|nr:hypothetical protein B0H11DRAFT_1903780 [Mycena galericulata]